MKPDISVVLPSRGRGQKLECLLECLARQSVGPGTRFEVVIALDGQEDIDLCALQSRLPYAITSLKLPQVGISAAKNAAVAKARGEILILVNDDIEPAENFVQEHARAHAAGHHVVLGGSPWKRFPDESAFDALIARTRMIFFYCDLVGGRNYDFRHAWNLNLSVDRELLIRQDGPFAEGLRPVFYDDVEFAFRLIGAEPLVHYQPAADAVHNHRYGFRGYFEREALLGVMAPVLWRVNADCFRAVFRCTLPELADQAETAIDLDIADGRRLLARFSELAETPWNDDFSEELAEAWYLAHLPLKRRAFRSGLRASMECPDAPWPSRPAMARTALAGETVFRDLPPESEHVRQDSSRAALSTSTP